MIILTIAKVIIIHENDLNVMKSAFWSMHIAI